MGRETEEAQRRGGCASRKLGRKRWACRRDVRPLRCPDDSFLVSIVDEAHALLNSEKKAQVGPTGWPAAFGPQAFHVMRASKVSIFLLDSEQSFRDRETTTAADLERWASLANAAVQPRISLAGAQFRAGGSTEYLGWVERLFGWPGGDGEAAEWRRSPTNSNGKFEFEVLADPKALEESLRARLAEGASARLLAAYGRPWKTKRVRSPHGLPGAEKDFHIPYERNGKPRYWSNVWTSHPEPLRITRSSCRRRRGRRCTLIRYLRSAVRTWSEGSTTTTWAFCG